MNTDWEIVRTLIRSQFTPTDCEIELKKRIRFCLFIRMFIAPSRPNYTQFRLYKYKRRPLFNTCSFESLVQFQRILSRTTYSELHRE